MGLQTFFWFPLCNNPPSIFKKLNQKWRGLINTPPAVGGRDTSSLCFHPWRPGTDVNARRPPQQPHSRSSASFAFRPICILTRVEECISCRKCASRKTDKYETPSENRCAPQRHAPPRANDSQLRLSNSRASVHGLCSLSRRLCCVSFSSPLSKLTYTLEKKKYWLPAPSGHGVWEASTWVSSPAVDFGGLSGDFLVIFEPSIRLRPLPDHCSSSWNHPPW